MENYQNITISEDIPGLTVAIGIFWDMEQSLRNELSQPNPHNGEDRLSISRSGQVELLGYLRMLFSELIKTTELDTTP